MQRRHISPPPVSPCWPPACNIQPSFCGRQWQWQWQCRQQTAMPLQPCVLCACPAGLARRQPQCACCRCWQQLLTRSRTICMQHGGLRRQQLQPMRMSALRRALLPLALHGWSGYWSTCSQATEQLQGDVPALLNALWELHTASCRSVQRYPTFHFTAALTKTLSAARQILSATGDPVQSR